MELLITLFWLGLWLSLAVFIFQLALGLVGFIFTGIFLAGAWIISKLTGKDF